MKPMLISIEVTMVILFISGVCIYNSLTKAKNRVEASKSIINSYIIKRYSLVSSLVVVVKGYAKHESSTLEKVITARSPGKAEVSTDDISSYLPIKSFYALSEKYPDLKADNLFSSLLLKLEKLENDLLESRKAYNDTVLTYNDKVTLFPISIYAYIFGFKKADYIDVDESKEDISFSI